MSDKMLTKPIRVGNKTLKNRMVMPPMEARLNTPDGNVTREMIDYYEARALGGASMIIVENTFVDDAESRSSLISSGLYNDHMIAGKNLLAEAIQDAGAVAIIQLSHGGRQASAAATGLQPVAPSAIACKVTQRIPRALSLQEIEKIEDSFASAALRAKMAGFDGVEIHGAHGYLVFSFFSKYSNKRTDEFGGNIENRARFAKNILKKVREKVGREFIVGLRISGSDFIEDGFAIEDACSTVALLQKYIDYIHVSGGVYETSNHSSIVPLYGPMGSLVAHAGAIKKCVDIPVITVGSLDVNLGEQALQDGNADIVAFGRSLIADPELPNKVINDCEDDIRPCIRGNEGCLSRFFKGCTMRCEVNPACGREKAFAIKKADVVKNVIVAGGGPAGMEAARVASLMGHKVTLIEKSECLGGHIIEGSIPAFKNKVSELLEWQKRQLDKSGVQIKLGTEATHSTVELLKPDVLIVAVGSKYCSINVAGAENALFADIALNNPEALGKNVVIVGGGLIGCETALMLAQDYAKNVTILEMMDDILQDLEPGSKESLTYYLDQANVKIICGYKVDCISPDEVVCSNYADKKCLRTDSVVLATGLLARRDVAKALDGIAQKTIEIGDCVKARRIYDAMHDAWKAARKI